MSLQCPVCANALLQIPLHGRVSHLCPRKHGRAFSVSVIRRWLKEEAIPILEKAISSAKDRGCVCPRCKKRMKLIKFAAELDHCESCGLLWFDAGEHEVIPQRSEKELVKEQSVESDLGVSVAPGIQFRAGLDPYENMGEMDTGFPIFTTLLILAFVVITFLARSHGYEGYVFNVARPFADAGVPALLSIFAHANAAHLGGNAIFFFLPGAMIEATFGEKVLIQGFFLGAFAAMVAEVFFVRSGYSLGASAGISAVFTILCLTRPHAVHVSQEHGFLLRAMSFYTITYRVPMWMVFLGWLGSQLGGLWGQSVGNGSNVSYIGHLAGAAGGLLYVLGSDLKTLSPSMKRGEAS